MYFLNFGFVEYLVFMYNVYPIISVILTLSSISKGTIFWSVNQTSVDENSVFVVFSIINECGAILSNCPNCLFGKKVNNTFDDYW